MTQISSLLPKTKIIMILRNPTSRAYSGDSSLLFPSLDSPSLGFHHNCRHGRFSRVIHPFEHHGTSYPVKSVIRVDEEYNRNEDRSSSDGDFGDRNNLLVCSLRLLSTINISSQDVPQSSLSPIPKGECTAEDFHRFVISFFSFSDALQIHLSLRSFHKAIPPRFKKSLIPFWNGRFGNWAL